eukprot:TRINITY_DN10547_c0_g1_i1.p1 TRINITY_DN10547_c0_g1~~TRINITY_DN10547_c0_g1_i1.p1  ORF type:complete len:2041 (+),score=353.29 TRINITY_DN10547_c0_g1_i1:76-6198(+)
MSFGPCCGAMKSLLLVGILAVGCLPCSLGAKLTVRATRGGEGSLRTTATSALELGGFSELLEVRSGQKRHGLTSLQGIERSLLSLANTQLTPGMESFIEQVLRITDQDMKETIRAELPVLDAQLWKKFNRTRQCETDYLMNAMQASIDKANEMPGLKEALKDCIDRAAATSLYITGPAGNLKGGFAGGDNTPQCVLNPESCALSWDHWDNVDYRHAVKEHEKAVEHAIENNLTIPTAPIWTTRTTTQQWRPEIDDWDELYIVSHITRDDLFYLNGVYEKTGDWNEVKPIYQKGGQNGPYLLSVGGKWTLQANSGATHLIAQWQNECTREVLMTELSAADGKLSNGLGQFAADWRKDALIRFGWDQSYIQFTSAVNPFVNRTTGGAPGTKEDNQVFVLSNFSTSDSLLQTWVTYGGGAVLCVSSSSSSTVAFAILPADNSAWALGCHGGEWLGRGAYYADIRSGGGWVGVKDTRAKKATTSETVGLKISVTTCGLESEVTWKVKGEDTWCNAEGVLYKAEFDNANGKLFDAASVCQKKCEEDEQCRFYGVRTADLWCEFWSSCENYFETPGHNVFQKLADKEEQETCGTYTCPWGYITNQAKKESTTLLKTECCLEVPSCSDVSSTNAVTSRSQMISSGANPGEPKESAFQRGGGVWGNHMKDQWVGVDLGHAKQIVKTEIKADHWPLQFSIQFSDDASTWTTVHRESSQPSKENYTAEWSNEGSHRYWRMYLLDNSRTEIDFIGFFACEEAVTKEPCNTTTQCSGDRVCGEEGYCKALCSVHDTAAQCPDWCFWDGTVCEEVKYTEWKDGQFCTNNKALSSGHTSNYACFDLASKDDACLDRGKYIFWNQETKSECHCATDRCESRANGNNLSIFTKEIEDMGYVGCVIPAVVWDKQENLIPVSKAGALDCKQTCKMSNYSFYGLTCPKSSGDAACYCAHEFLGVDKPKYFCKGAGNHKPHEQCNGVYFKDEYLFGDNNIMAVYSSTDSVVYEDYKDLQSVKVNDGAAVTEDAIKSRSTDEVNTEAVFVDHMTITTGQTIVMTYNYIVGGGCSGEGATFDVYVGNTKMSSIAPLGDFPYDSCDGTGCPACYSPEHTLRLEAKRRSWGPLKVKFHNGVRYMHLKVKTIWIEQETVLSIARRRQERAIDYMADFSETFSIQKSVDKLKEAIAAASAAGLLKGELNKAKAALIVQETLLKVSTSYVGDLQEIRDAINGGKKVGLTEDQLYRLQFALRHLENYLSRSGTSDDPTSTKYCLTPSNAHEHCKISVVPSSLDQLPSNLTVSNAIDENLNGVYQISQYPSEGNAVWLKLDVLHHGKIRMMNGRWTVTCVGCHNLGLGELLMRSRENSVQPFTPLSPTAVETWEDSESNVITPFVAEGPDQQTPADFLDGINVQGIADDAMNGVYLNVKDYRGEWRLSADGKRLWIKEPHGPMFMSEAGVWKMTDLAGSTVYLQSTNAVDAQADRPDKVYTWQAMPTGTLIAGITFDQATLAEIIAANPSPMPPKPPSPHQVPSALNVVGAEKCKFASLINGEYAITSMTNDAGTAVWQKNRPIGPLLTFESGRWVIESASSLVSVELRQGKHGGTTLASQADVQTALLPTDVQSWVDGNGAVTGIAVTVAQTDGVIGVIDNTVIWVGEEDCVTSIMCPLSDLTCDKALEICKDFRTFDRLSEVNQEPDPHTSVCTSLSQDSVPHLEVRNISYENSLLAGYRNGGDYYRRMQEYWQNMLDKWDSKYSNCAQWLSWCQGNNSACPVCPQKGPFPNVTTTTTSTTSTTSMAATTITTTTAGGGGNQSTATSTTTTTTTTLNNWGDNCSATALESECVPPCGWNAESGNCSLMDCWQQQIDLDRAGCQQGKLQIQACEDYDNCFDNANSSLSDAWHRICDEYGELYQLQMEATVVYRIECVLHALKVNATERGEAITNCVKKPNEDYNVSWVSLEKCQQYKDEWPTAASITDDQCLAAKRVLKDRDISGTDPYINYWYQGIDYPQTCLSQCCVMLPNPYVSLFRQHVWGFDSARAKVNHVVFGFEDTGFSSR